MGIEVYDASGNAIMTMATKACRVLGSFQSSGSGSMTVAEFSMGIPFAFVLPFGQGGLTYASPPTVSISGTTLSWTYPSSYYGNVDAIIVYGIS